MENLGIELMIARKSKKRTTVRKIVTMVPNKPYLRDISVVACPVAIKYVHRIKIPNANKNNKIKFLILQ